MSDDTGWINAHNPGWQDLHSIGRVESRVEAKGIITQQVRFYICSLAGDLPIFAKAVRGHWSIENSLHWILDVVFREDYGRVRKDNAPKNFAIIKHAAINLINKNKGTRSTKASRKQAGWNNNALLGILASSFYGFKQLPCYPSHLG
jgi:predicted transposase YbfD/YdcC